MTRTDFCVGASTRAYLSLLAVMSVPLALALLVVIRGPSGSAEFIIFSALLPAFWGVWLSWFRLCVDDKRIAYRQPFRRTKIARWTDVRDVKVGRVLLRQTGDLTSTLARIEVYSKDAELLLAINSRVFPLDKLRLCLKLMKEHVATCD